MRWGSEKVGGSAISMNSAQDFNQCIDSFALLELPLQGPTFTWSNSFVHPKRIECKLDRALINIAFNIRLVDTEEAQSIPLSRIIGGSSFSVKILQSSSLLLNISILRLGTVLLCSSISLEY